MEKMVQMIVEAYASVYGAQKWKSLDAKQQHDVIMTIAKDFAKALDNID